MIEEGRIAIEGRILDTPATLLASLHGVTVDGKPVAAPAPARLFRFHKPAGFLTTERDPAGRPTIYDHMPPGLPRLVPVGRLDMNTEGLLLLTTDGGLKRQLELPATGVERIYRARTFGDISQETLETLIEGIEIEGMVYGPIDANLERRTGAISGSRCVCARARIGRFAESSNIWACRCPGHPDRLRAVRAWRSDRAERSMKSGSTTSSLSARAPVTGRCSTPSVRIARLLLHNRAEDERKSRPAA